MRKATEKIVSREKLLSLLAAAKQRGQRIVSPTASSTRSTSATLVISPQQKPKAIFS